MKLESDKVNKQLDANMKEMDINEKIRSNKADEQIEKSKLRQDNMNTKIDLQIKAKQANKPAKGNS